MSIQRKEQQHACLLCLGSMTPKANSIRSRVQIATSKHTGETQEQSVGMAQEQPIAALMKYDLHNHVCPTYSYICVLCE